MKSNSKRKILLMAMSMAIATPVIVTLIPLTVKFPDMSPRLIASIASMLMKSDILCFPLKSPLLD